MEWGLAREIEVLLTDVSNKRRLIRADECPDSVHSYTKTIDFHSRARAIPGSYTGSREFRCFE
jgi:hypothetical protein